MFFFPIILATLAEHVAKAVELYSGVLYPVTAQYDWICSVCISFSGVVPWHLTRSLASFQRRASIKILTRKKLDDHSFKA